MTCVLAAAIVSGLDTVPVFPGCRVLYLMGSSSNPSTLVHLSDVAGTDGIVYAVNNSEVPLLHQPNVVMIAATDQTDTTRYAMNILDKVDAIFCEQNTNQIRVLKENAEHFLKPNGQCVILVAPAEIDPNVPESEVYSQQVLKFKGISLKPQMQLTLEPHHTGRAIVTCVKPSDS
eukprot:c9411_g1_i1.p1 GENE.c9411_g1_i1~~c9411_g1_i1.p1  ORF type:complete len:175 (-),score=33.75 c9411_g1_i1:79-603(-)